MDSKATLKSLKIANEILKKYKNKNKYDKNKYDKNKYDKNKEMIKAINEIGRENLSD